jgi:hypothetical protein
MKGYPKPCVCACVRVCVCGPGAVRVVDGAGDEPVGVGQFTSAVAVGLAPGLGVFVLQRGGSDETLPAALGIDVVLLVDGKEVVRPLPPLDVGATVELMALSRRNGDTLTFQWTMDGSATFASDGNSSVFVVTAAPSHAGTVINVECQVTGPLGEVALYHGVSVSDLSPTPSSGPSPLPSASPLFFPSPSSTWVQSSALKQGSAWKLSSAQARVVGAIAGGVVGLIALAGLIPIVQAMQRRRAAASSKLRSSTAGGIRAESAPALTDTDCAVVVRAASPVSSVPGQHAGPSTDQSEDLVGALFRVRAPAVRYLNRDRHYCSEMTRLLSCVAVASNVRL